MESRAKSQLSNIGDGGHCVDPSAKHVTSGACHKFAWFEGEPTRERLRKETASRKLTLTYLPEKKNMAVQIYRWDGAKSYRIRNTTTSAEKLHLEAAVAFWSFK